MTNAVLEVCRTHNTKELNDDRIEKKYEETELIKYVSFLCKAFGIGKKQCKKEFEIALIRLRRGESYENIISSIENQFSVIF